MEIDKLFDLNELNVFHGTWFELYSKASDVFLFSPVGQLLRDGYIAIAVGIYLNASKARLCKSDPPDFELKTEKGLFGFECVEGYQPGRRRGDEYKNEQPPDLGTAVDWRSRALEAHNWFNTAIELKAKKYVNPQGFSLAIYLSTRSFGVAAEKEIHDCCCATAQEYSNNFQSIWLILGSRPYLLSDRSRLFADLPANIEAVIKFGRELA